MEYTDLIWKHAGIYVLVKRHHIRELLNDACDLVGSMWLG